MLARIVVAVTVSGCMLALASCGSDDDASGSEDSTTESSPTTATAAPTTATAAPTTATDAPTTETTGPTETTEPTAATETTATEPSTAPDTSGTGMDASTEPDVCEPYLQVSAAFAGEPDPATIGELLDQVDATAPAEIADQVAVLTGGARTVLDTGDFSVFEQPDFSAAVAAADGWVVENCVFATTTEIVATEYEYDGQADEYPAGRTAFNFVNEGAEAHELAIIRKNDGVDVTLAELMELPEAEAETMTTYVGATFVGPTGATGNLIVDLTPGDYIAVCNVLAGTVVADDGSFTEGTGQPHVMLGMSFEFSVA